MTATNGHSNPTKEPTSADVLRQYSHPIAKSSEIEDKPFKSTLLDQPLVLWRSNGRIGAFYDLCIHRGTPLSLGWIADGQLVCAYHGWRYHADGACSSIPSIPAGQPIPAKARVMGRLGVFAYLIMACWLPSAVKQCFITSK